MAFRPLLAGKFSEKDQKYPAFVSAKIDGIRVRAFEGVAIARSNKPIPNEHVQRLFKHHAEVLEDIDGEIIVGLPYSDGKIYPRWDSELKEEVMVLDDPYDRTTGAIRRKDGKPEFKVYVFDIIHPTENFTERRQRLEKRVFPDFVKVLPHKLVHSYEEVLAFEELCLTAGYEGIMVRSPTGKYKQGRSTEKEGILLKLKRPTGAEAVITGFVEEMENLNEATTNELGHTARSSHKDNKRGKNRLGSFIARGVTGKFTGATFNVGTGLSEAQREAFWRMKDKLLGATFEYEFFLVGSKDAPRFPSFKRLRDGLDLDPSVNDLVSNIQKELDDKRRVERLKEELEG